MAVTRYADIASRISLLGFDRAQMQLTRFQTGLTTFATKARMAGMAMLKMGGLMAAGIGLMVKAGMDYEERMADVRAVTGLNREEFEKLNKTARETARTSIFTGRQVADSYYYLASAGIKSAEVMDKLGRVSLKIATAGAMELGGATEMLVATIRRFNMTVGKEAADRVGNVFAAAVSNSQATLERLGISMRYVGAQASALDYSLEETVAILEALYDKGYEASQAGTMMRMAFIRMIKPTGEARDILDDLELSFIDASGQIKKMPIILDEMREALKDYTSAEKAAALATIFGARSVSGMLSLLSMAPGRLRDYQKGITDTTKLNDMMAVKMETLRATFKLLFSAIQELAISFTEALKPSIEKVTKIVTGLVNKFNNLSDSTKETIARLSGLSSVIGIVGGLALILASQFALLIANLTVLVPKVIALAKAMTLAKLAIYGEIAVIAAGIAVIGKTTWELKKLIKIKNEFTEATMGAARGQAALGERLKAYLPYIIKASKYKVSDLVGDPKKVKDVEKAIKALTVLSHHRDKALATQSKSQLDNMKKLLESHNRLGDSVNELTNRQIDNAKMVGRVSEEEMKKRLSLARDIVRERSSIEDELLGKIKDIEEEKARVRREISSREEDRETAIAKSRQLATGEAVGYWDEVNKLVEYGKNWGIDNAKKTLEGKSDTLKEWINQNAAAQYALQRIGLLGGDIERERMEERLNVLDKEKSDTNSLMEIRLKALDKIVAKERLINEIMEARKGLIGPGGRIVPAFYQDNKFEFTVDTDKMKDGVKEAIDDKVGELEDQMKETEEEMKRSIIATQ